MPVNVGTLANDGTGDAIRTAFIKINNEREESLSEMRSGRIFLAAAMANPSGAAIPAWAVGIETHQHSGNLTRWWRPVAAPVPAVETATLKLDANGRWWQKLRDADLDSELAAMRDDAAIGRTYTAEIATPATAPIPASVASVFCVFNAAMSCWLPTSAPSNGQATETLVRDGNLRWWRRAWLSSEGGTTPSGTTWNDTSTWNDTTNWSE